MILTFARRISRKLGVNQKRLISDLLPKIQFDKNESSTFKNITLEIGFGNGEFTANNAIQNPDDLHIGCEPFLNGVGALLGKIDELNIKNIRIFADDARILLEKIPNDFLSCIYIICPDPWPKPKYHKRRLIQKDLIQLLRTKLKSDGNLVFVTDHEGYAKWILNEINKCYNQFENCTLGDFYDFPDGWHFTKYQRRGLNLGSKLHYFKLPK